MPTSRYRSAANNLDSFRIGRLHSQVGCEVAIFHNGTSGPFRETRILLVTAIFRPTQFLSRRRDPAQPPLHHYTRRAPLSKALRAMTLGDAALAAEQSKHGR